MQSYKDLIVWQKAITLVKSVYELTEHFPKAELFGMTSQMRRSAVSIASNIAEGSRRGTRKDFRQFILMAYGSGAELETHIEIVKQLPFGKKLSTSAIESLLSEVMRMLNALERKLGGSTHYSLPTTH